jgi:4a-hydroxytetrahydrobiopterin dehydratase
VSELAERSCVPCKGGIPPMPAPEIAELLPLIQGWEAVRDHHLVKTYAFKNFAEALAFVDRIGAMAEEQWHHPDVHLGWGKVTVEIWTHKIDGLTESDFVFAAKCDALQGAKSS